MLAQTNLRKGFTLIELMVVIVIIGILAAIAIPKLFGMSAKAKAQEVGPAVGTWSKLQLAYKMETGYYGGAKQISYKAPGMADATKPGEGKTSNFEYTAANDDAQLDAADWEATNQFSSDPCGDKKGKWTAKFADKDSDMPEMDITGNDAEGCLTLTPNYFKIGCTNNSTLKTDSDIACPTSGP